MLSEKQVSHLYKILGNRIRENRIKADYNQSEFAELLQLSRASLVNIEKGRQRPTLHFLYGVANILKIDFFSLFPKSEDLVEKEISKDLLKKIKLSSKGNIDVEESLIQFVKQSTNPSK